MSVIRHIVGTAGGIVAARVIVANSRVIGLFLGAVAWVFVQVVWTPTEAFLSSLLGRTVPTGSVLLFLAGALAFYALLIRTFPRTVILATLAAVLLGAYGADLPL